MKIVSDDSLLLDELYVELKKEHIKSTKETKHIKGAMSVEVAVAVAIIGMGVEAVEKLINLYRVWRDTKRINYIHVKYKDGRERKYNHLDDKELEEIRQKLLEDEEEIEYSETGKLDS